MCIGQASEEGGVGTQFAPTQCLTNCSKRGCRGWERQPTETFSNSGTEPLAPTEARPLKEEDGGCDLFPLGAPHGLIKGLQNQVDNWHWPDTNAQSGQCGPHSALRVWAGNWAPVTIVAQTEPPSSWDHRKGKVEPPPLSLQDPGRPAKPVWQVENQQ